MFGQVIQLECAKHNQKPCHGCCKYYVYCHNISLPHNTRWVVAAAAYLSVGFACVVKINTWYLCFQGEALYNKGTGTIHSIACLWVISQLLYSVSRRNPKPLLTYYWVESAAACRALSTLGKEAEAQGVRFHSIPSVLEGQRTSASPVSVLEYPLAYITL